MNLRPAWNFDWRVWGGICFAAWVLFADLMHQTGLRFCGRVTARYWQASVSFNSVSRSWLLNAVNLRTEISTAIPDVFCFLFPYDFCFVSHWNQTRGNQTRHLILRSNILSFVLFTSCHGCVQYGIFINMLWKYCFGYFIRIYVCLLQMKTYRLKDNYTGNSLVI